MTEPLSRSDVWPGTIQVCRSCDSPLGTVRCVLVLKICPECGASLFPVEEETESVTVTEVRS